MQHGHRINVKNTMMQCFLVSSLQRAPTPAKMSVCSTCSIGLSVMENSNQSFWVILYYILHRTVTASTAVKRGASMSACTNTNHFLLEDPAKSLLGELLGMLCRHPPKVAIGLWIWVTAAKFRQQLPHRNPLNLFGKALGIQQEPYTVATGLGLGHLEIEPFTSPLWIGSLNQHSTLWAPLRDISCM